jgi:hypothetical protein
MVGGYLRRIWTGGACGIQNNGWKSITKNSLLPGSLTWLIWLTLGAFAIGTEGFMIAGLLPALARELNVGLPAAGHLVTAFSLAYAIAAPVMAVLTPGIEDRGQIGESLRDGDVGDIGHPELIRPGWLSAIGEEGAPGGPRSQARRLARSWKMKPMKSRLVRAASSEVIPDGS